MEFEDYRDAEDAYYEMQHRKVDGYSLSIQVSSFFCGFFCFLIHAHKLLQIVGQKRTWPQLEVRRPPRGRQAP